MARDPSFRDFVLDLLSPMLEGVEGRAMFGGWGLYHEGRIFGIIVDGAFYLQTDDGNRSAFAPIGSRPFSYEKRDGTRVALSYWLVPEETLEDRERLEELVQGAVRASQSRSD